MSTRKPYLLIVTLLFFLLLISCTEKKTSNAVDSYKYWAESNPPDDLELLDGQYWQSSHWTKEYILYLRFKPTNKWWSDFIKKNALSKDNRNWTLPSDAPTWFRPSIHSIRFLRDGDSDQGSRYFHDCKSGICFIYEIQL